MQKKCYIMGITDFLFFSFAFGLFNLSIRVIGHIYMWTVTIWSTLLPWVPQAVHASWQNDTIPVVSSLINQSHVEKGGLRMFYHGWNWKGTHIPELHDQGWKSHGSLSLSLPARHRSAATRTFGSQLSLRMSERQMECLWERMFKVSGEFRLLIQQQTTLSCSSSHLESLHGKQGPDILSDLTKLVCDERPLKLFDSLKTPSQGPEASLLMALPWCFGFFSDSFVLINIEKNRVAAFSWRDYWWNLDDGVNRSVASQARVQRVL